MKRVGLVCLFLGLFISSSSQDLQTARKFIDTLTSKYFWGRGYTNNGMQKTAQFLAAEFKSYGLQPLNAKGFLQEFSYPVNTFPGKMDVTVNGKQLNPGVDFIVSPESPSRKVSGTLIQQDSTYFIDRKNQVVVSLQPKLTWSVSTFAESNISIVLNKNSLKEKPTSIALSIENKMLANFKASNVCGLVRGTTQPDSLLVITAHYDHLGGMGSDTYFPGANDDASGVTLLLTLAKHYSQHPLPYSVAFICFAGEEAGLIGSKHFSEKPLFQLSSIRFLLNLDLVGTGEEGITVVNGSVFRKEFALLNSINDQEKYVVKIKSRGKAANSDHYWFTEKGVPSFFIYAMGGIQAYHDVYDRGATLPLTEFEDLYHLVVDFNDRLINKNK
jgi:hypothetical protein